MMTKLAISNIIDIDTYPVHDLVSGDAKQLIERVRNDLNTDGSAVLPNFVRTDALQRLAAEGNRLAPLAFRGPTEASPYFFNYRLGEGGEWPADHPLQRKTPRRLSQVAYDLIPTDTVLCQLYHDDTLTHFLSAVRGERVYRNADPYQALNISVMEEGGCQQWHFDGGNMVTTLLLQAPEGGGVFEYAPNIRSPDNENFDAVQRVLDGDLSGVKRIELEAGMLALFKGHYSMHRVTEVTGARHRLQAILGYLTTPNFRGKLESSILHYGPRVAEIEGSTIS